MGFITVLGGIKTTTKSGLERHIVDKLDGVDAPKEVSASPAVKVRTQSSSATVKGKDLGTSLEKLFSLLINAIINNLDPNLDPKQENPIYTIIDAKINLSITIFDENDNDLKKISLVFNLPSDPNLLEIGSSGLTVSRLDRQIGSLSSTSASIIGTLSQFRFLLIKQIASIVENVDGTALTIT